MSRGAEKGLAQQKKMELGLGRNSSNKNYKKRKTAAFSPDVNL
jgi:hypothetical protein